MRTILINRWHDLDKATTLPVISGKGRHPDHRAETTCTRFVYADGQMNITAIVTADRQAPYPLAYHLVFQNGSVGPFTFDLKLRACTVNKLSTRSDLLYLSASMT